MSARRRLEAFAYGDEGASIRVSCDSTIAPSASWTDTPAYMKQAASEAFNIVWGHAPSATVCVELTANEIA